MTKKLDQCRTYKDYSHFVITHGGSIEDGGRHAIAHGPGGGICPIPRHPGDIPPGTRRSINARLIMIGIGILVILCPATVLIEHFLKLI